MKTRNLLGSEPLSAAWVSVVALCLLALITAADAAIGAGLSFTFFHLVVIIGATWLGGGRAGYLATAGAALGLVVADLVWHVETGVALWNGGMELLSFVVTVRFVALLRRRLIEEGTLARLDALTGLLNAFAFRERATLLAERGPPGASRTLVFIDLDNFKLVNDTLGHNVGSAALARIGDVIRDHFRFGDLACRLGGDEFAVMLVSKHPVDVETRLAHLLQDLKTAMRHRDLPITFSIGAVTYRQPLSLEGALAKADALMYEVKRNGKNGYLHRTIAGAENSAPDPPLAAASWLRRLTTASAALGSVFVGLATASVAIDDERLQRRNEAHEGALDRVNYIVESALSRRQHEHVALLGKLRSMSADELRSMVGVRASLLELARSDPTVRDDALALLREIE